MQILNSMLLNNDWVKEEIREWTQNMQRQMRISIQNTEAWGNAAKVVIRESLFLSLQAYLKKIKTISNKLHGPP